VTEERNLFLQQSQNIFIFSAYTDACTSSCKIVVASKRPLIFKHLYTRAFVLCKIFLDPCFPLKASRKKASRTKASRKKVSRRKVSRRKASREKDYHAQKLLCAECLAQKLF